MALIYIDRLVKIQGIVVNRFTIHRLLATATVVSAKFLDDQYYSNKWYADVCGLKLKQLNSLERCFMSLLRWKVAVSPEEFGAYQSQVLRAVQTVQEK
eukprot:CAMPEP_0197622722 /NCGR_PEP_ID=MMETSP1338-20131121/2902_1 /TAXON_ID=43686 ORGANISM="Pelagodinium beii, Strain RCC1491" /NCGR_SAMPLE_ID=MMETSP1338 /ASSEMBLY_ACC=CAM_ASM_000754 /LENGTH=97 /DNA_ID=CAMNT_0043192471 /DNA_START=43 /DNA_END=336 /DNA_ORIENTATION=-